MKIISTKYKRKAEREMDENFYTLPKSIPSAENAAQTAATHGLYDAVMAVGKDLQLERPQDLAWDVCTDSRLIALRDELVSLILEHVGSEDELEEIDEALYANENIYTDFNIEEYFNRRDEIPNPITYRQIYDRVHGKYHTPYDMVAAIAKLVYEGNYQGYGNESPKGAVATALELLEDMTGRWWDPTRDQFDAIVNSL